MSPKKTKVCRFCKVPQGQQHLHRCLYVQRPSLYMNTVAWIDADSSSPSSSSSGSCDGGSSSSHDSGGYSCGSAC